MRVGVRSKKKARKKEASNSVRLTAEKQNGLSPVSATRDTDTDSTAAHADDCSRRERGTCHPIVPETRWKAWEGREESAPPVAMPGSMCSMCSMPQAGRVTVCIFRSFHRPATPPGPGCLPTRRRRGLGGRWKPCGKNKHWNPHATPSTTTRQPAMRPKPSTGCSHRFSSSLRREHQAAREVIQTGYAPATH